MRIPKSQEVDLHCICCGEIIQSNEDSNTYVNVASWQESVVTTAYAGISSSFNGLCFVIGICDTCIKGAKNKNHIHIFHDSQKESMTILN